MSKDIHRLVVQKLAKHRTWKRMIWSIVPVAPDEVKTKVKLRVVQIDVNPEEVAKIYTKKLLKSLFEGGVNGNTKY